MPANTNEWEFQGQALGWLNDEIRARSLPFQGASQEFPNKDGRRSDVIVWINRIAREAILEVELKRPEVPLGDKTFQRDAIRKAQHVNAPYVALWNMQSLRLYRTPPTPRKDFLATDLLAELGHIPSILKSNDWLQASNRDRLHGLARDLLLAVYDLRTHGVVHRRIVDATIFVDYLSDALDILKQLLDIDVRTDLTRDRSLNEKIRNWAGQQGLLQFVDDLHAALAGQLAYRLAGQTLFYLALRRIRKDVPRLEIDPERPTWDQIRAYWDQVRSIDYEALYEPSPLEEIKLSSATLREVARLINWLKNYDWDSVKVDVLGSIFEQMIPAAERVLLGQYYTPPRLVDLIVGLTVDPSNRVLDPAVGTGTFLYRAYDFIRRTTDMQHADILPALWGLDISAFATELAVINLCRLDFTSQHNFPRIAVRDFFDVTPGIELTFPPAKYVPGGPPRVQEALPVFDAIVGNPPYIRSQHLDDIDSRYKRKLERMLVTERVGIPPRFEAPKFDAFAYFLVHAAKFLRPGGRIGLVTSAAWLTSGYGSVLQRFLLERFRSVMVIWSLVEPFFSSIEVDTVIVVLERSEGEESPGKAASLRFVALKSPVISLVGEPDAVDYWSRIRDLASDLERVESGTYHGYRVLDIDGAEELQHLREEPRAMRNWAKYLRMTELYLTLFGTV